MIVFVGRVDLADDKESGVVEVFRLMRYCLKSAQKITSRCGEGDRDDIVVDCGVAHLNPETWVH